MYSSLRLLHNKEHLSHISQNLTLLELEDILQMLEGKECLATLMSFIGTNILPNCGRSCV
jgi:hypothetical protein